MVAAIKCGAVPTFVREGGSHAYFNAGVYSASEKTGVFCLVIRASHRWYFDLDDEFVGC